MAQNTTISVLANTWTELTNSDVTEITFQNISGNYLLVKGTTGAAPSETNGSVRYSAGQGEQKAVLEDVFPGVSGAVRLWAFAYENVRVMVSHA